MCVVACSVASLAQEPGFAGLIPPQATVDIVEGKDIAVAPGEETHPPLRLTPDRSELVRVKKPIASIVIGNPEHANILMDSPNLLVVVPRTPGATFFTALDGDGNVVMQRHVIVAGPKKNYVRIRRSCANASGSCQETSVFYCPDMCHEIGVSSEGGDGASGALSSVSGGAAGMADATAGAATDQGEEGGGE